MKPTAAAAAFFALIFSALPRQNALAAASTAGALIGAGAKSPAEGIDAKLPVPEALNPADALDEKKVGAAAKFVSIKPGEFLMGSTGEAPRGNDETPHFVKLTKGFEMQTTETTQLQYFLVMGNNPATFSKEKLCDEGNFKVINGVSLCANHPVETVAWEDVQRFIGRLNKIQNQYVYRLPTEAEREYAARGGMPSTARYRYPIGESDPGEMGDFIWYDRNAEGHTHAVATKKPNPYGLHDMAGNVCEATNDWYDAYPLDPVVDPTGPAKSFRHVIRGGSWHRSAAMQRSGYRGPGYLPGAISTQIGFRLVRTSR